MKIYHFLFEVTPAPGSRHFASAGGGFVNCWIKAPDEAGAERKASRYIAKEGWEIVALEDMSLPDLISYQDSPESLELYERARETGEAYLIYTWPPEPQDQDLVQ